VAATDDRVVLVRHGETPWSRAGKHTGRTEVPLTERGRREAEAVGNLLRGRRFALVATSPLGRAVETCRLAGFGESAEQWPELAEWDYGGYEGLTSAEIRATHPGWSLWRDGVSGGETIAQVGARADLAIARLRSVAGAAVVFAHGHFLRVLAARWLDLAPAEGRLFVLDSGTISILGYEHEAAAIRLWNEPSLPG
jgi:probable phosphoglycerate mutase